MVPEEMSEAASSCSSSSKKLLSEASSDAQSACHLAAACDRHFRETSPRRHFGGPYARRRLLPEKDSFYSIRLHQSSSVAARRRQTSSSTLPLLLCAIVLISGFRAVSADSTTADLSEALSGQSFSLAKSRLARSAAANGGPFLHFAFVSEPSDQVVVAKQSLELHCGASVTETGASVSVEWRKDGDTLPAGDRRTLERGGTLRISAFERNDEGSYQCVASVGLHGETWKFVSRKAVVRLAVLPRFEAQLDDQTATVGDVVLLPCRVDAVPPATVRWYKNDEPLEPAEGARLRIFPLSGSLEIGQLRREDAGVYKCRATNPDKSRYSREGRLTVVEAADGAVERAEPRILVEPRGQVVREGDGALLECAARGVPPPDVDWLHNGDALDTAASDRFRRVGQGSLEIVAATAADSGSYTCRATNSEDVADATALLQVHVAPTFSRRPESLSSKETTDVQFECAAEGEPGAAIVWFKNGELILPSEYFIIEGTTLKVLGLVTTDQAVYQCLAENAAGSAVASAQLRVEVADANGTWPLPLNSSTPPSTATNSDGSGESDAQSGVPSEPRSLRAVSVASRVVQLAWSSPLHTHGHIGTYSVFYKLDSSSRERVLNATERQATLAQLSPDAKYFVRVVAVNEHGAGLSSPPLLVRTDSERAVPGKVRKFRGFALTPTSVEMLWEPPAVGSAAVQYYRLFYTEGGADEPVEELADETEIQTSTAYYVLHGLQKFMEYSFRVEAFGQNGAGLSSDAIIVRTFSDVPSAAPRQVMAEAFDTKTVLVQWRPPPLSETNGVITGYKIKHKQKRRGSRATVTITKDGSFREQTLSGLQADTAYQVRVAAVNVNGTGPYSEAVRVHTLAKDKEEQQVPGPPTSLRVQARIDSIMISWTPPLDDGVMIRGYLIGWGINMPDVHKTEVGAHQRYHTIDGLKANRDYVVSLRAINLLGNGFPIYETVRTARPVLSVGAMDASPTLPPPFYVRTRVISSTSVQALWEDDVQRRRAGSSRHRYYTVRYKEASSAGQNAYSMANATETMVVLDKLLPYTQYEFSVRVVAGSSYSDWSLAVVNRTAADAPSSAPTDLTAVRAASSDPLSVMLNWQPPERMNGDILEYIIHYSTDPDLPEELWQDKGVPGNCFTTDIEGLLPKTHYYFMIHARNEIGYGPMSAMIAYDTAVGARIIVGDLERGGGGGGGANRPKGESRSAAALDQSAIILLVGIGCAALVACVLLVTVGVYCCRQKSRRGGGGYVAGKKAHVLKDAKPPPDLWIGTGHCTHDGRIVGDLQSSPGASMQDMKQVLNLHSPSASNFDPYHCVQERSARGDALSRSVVDVAIVMPSERRVGRAKPMPHAVVDPDGTGSLTRSYHQSSGSLEIQPPTARQRVPQVVYTGPRYMPKPSSDYEARGAYGSGMVAAATPPLPNGVPPPPPPGVTCSSESPVPSDGYKTLPHRSSNPLKSFTAAAPPPPLPPDGATDIYGSTISADQLAAAAATPRTQLVRPNAGRPTTTTVGGKPAGIVIGTKLTSAARAAQPSPAAVASARQPKTSLSDAPTAFANADSGSDIHHSYSTEELNAQMQNLDTMIDDLQAMQAEFNV